MDVFDFEVLENVVFRLNNINSNILLIKKNITSKANCVGYSNISSLLHTQVVKLESIENNLEQYANGIKKIYDGSLDNVDSVQTSDKVENKETDKFLDSLDDYAYTVSNALKKKLSWHHLSADENIYLTPSDIVKCEDDVLKNYGFTSNDRNRLAELMFKERTEDEELEYQTIIKSNENVKVSPETFEKGLFDLFDSVKENDKFASLKTNNENPFKYMYTIKTEYEYTDDPIESEIVEPEIVFIKGVEYSMEYYNKFVENYESDMYNYNPSPLAENFTKQEGTTWKIIGDQIIFRNDNYMKSLLHDETNNALFHYIKSVNQSNEDFLMGKYSFHLMNDKVGNFIYIGEVPQEVIDIGLALIPDVNERAAYEKALDGNYRQDAVNHLTNLYVNSIIFKDNLTENEKSFLSNCTNSQRTALASEIRDIVYDIEFGNQLALKYSDTIDELFSSDSNIVKVLLFDENRTEDETEYLKGIHITLDGNVTSITALDLEEFILINENSDITFDYENNEMIVKSKKYASFSDFLIDKYKLNGDVMLRLVKKNIKWILI